ncbi:hypothetical protein [Ottowia sp.]|uniref:hypothetical protein n=1 Tax=Ottowia sp. TaxID=1898956 RepID=UPI003A85C05A
MVAASALNWPASRSAVLVVLSPRMVYALHEWPRMRVAAEAAGFEVVLRRDPQVPANEWRAALEAAGMLDLSIIPVMEPQLAAACGLLNHFPSALVARCGQVHPWPVFGVMPSDMWRAVLVQRRDTLSCP